MKKLLFIAILLSGMLLLSSCGSNSSTPQYSLSLGTSPAEGGTATAPDQIFDKGSTASIIATANPEWMFVRWEGDFSSTDNPASVTMDADKDITAIFTKKTYTLTVNTTGQGSVDEQVVSAKPTDYESGTTVELTANPASGWEFVEWQGDLSGSDNPDQIFIDSPKEVTAVFGSTSFSLATNGVTIQCGSASVGDIGIIDGVTYTKRTVDQITPANAATSCTSGITNMNFLFEGESSFNADISHWDVSAVTTMGSLFDGASSFNGNLSNWDVSSVTNMESMFKGASSFNGDVGSWNVSAVINMGSMFRSANSFDQDLNSWDVSSVTDMASMFRDASSFNGDVSSWDVSGATVMASMFLNASSFNQDTGGWDVSNVTNMNFMFQNASSFNQDLSGWCVTNIASEPNGFSTGAPLTNANKPVWGTCPGM